MTKKERTEKYENKEFSGNGGEKFKVLKYNTSRIILIEFNETKNKKNVTANNIDTGAVRDTEEIHKTWMNTVYVNNNGNKFKITNYINKHLVEIRFTETGTIETVEKGNIDKGSVKDVYSKTIMNIGSYGKPSKKKYIQEAYKTWIHMMGRCYDIYNVRYEKNKEVEKRWHCFENFIEDIEKIENYKLWEENTGIHLDKDLKGNSRLYSLENCIFLTQKENARAGKYKRRQS